MKLTSALPSFAVAVAIGAACSTNVYTGPGFDTGSSTGVGGAGGAASASVSVGNGSGSTGGALPDVCEGFEDTTTATAVSLTIENNTAASVYINKSDCDFTVFPTVTDPNGFAVNYQNTSDGCGNTCQTLQQSAGGCVDACSEPFVVEIPAGGSYQLGTWGGTYLETTEMPAECFLEDLGSTQCELRLEAPAGNYELAVDLYDQRTCDSGNCMGCPSADGFCIHYGVQVMGPSRQAAYMLSHPTETEPTLFVMP